MSDVKITDNLVQLKQKLESARKAALQEIGETWNQDVLSHIGSEDQQLAGSRKYEVSDGQVKLGFTDEQAVAVELGTRDAASRPVLKPSIENNLRKYQEIIKKHYS